MQSKFLSPGRWLRVLAWLVGTVAILWGLGWFFVPRLIVQQLEKTASEQLGRKVSVGAVDFKPWTLELTISNLAIATQDGSQPQFQFKRLYANAELESLFRLAPVVESLALDEPRVRIAHLGGGKYDIDDILARFPAKPSEKPSEPLKFALFNLAIGSGAVVFEDRPVQKTHTLSALTLGIPFLSNLPARQNIKVEPRLSFDFNGSHFDSSAQTTPFALDRKTDASLVLSDLNLAPYLPYLPATLPVRLQQGVLGARVKLSFEQAPTPRMQLSGELGLQGVKVADAAGHDLLGFEALKVVFDDVRPLDKSARLSVVELVAPQVQIGRDASGRLNLDALTAPAPGSPAPSSAAAAGTADAPGWKLDLAKLVLREGTVQWTDAAVAPPSRLAAQSLALELTDFRWPMAQPMAFQGGLVLADLAAAPGGGKGAATPGPAELKFGGTATDRQAQVKVSLSDLPLALAGPYLAPVLKPSVSGRLRTELAIDWSPANLKVALASLVADGLALGPRAPSDTGPWPSVRQISVGPSEVDLGRRTVTVGKLLVAQPQAQVQRGRDGRWMFEDWLQPVPGGAQAPVAKPAPAPSRKPGAPAPVAPAWSVLLSDLQLDGGEIGYRDESTARPVAFSLSGLKLQARDLRPEGAKPIPVQVSARLRSERAEPGQLDFRGSLQWQPVVAQGSVSLTQIPVQVFEPYFGGGLNIELLRADTGFKGDVRFAQTAAGPSVQLTGDAVVEDFRANSLAAGDGGLQIAEELLNWKSLSVRGINLALTPGAATRVSVAETTLGDFFARVIVFPNGRINLQDLVKPASAPPASPQAGASATAAATAAAQPASAGSAATAGAATAGTDAVINIGPVALIQGKVFFSDRFVKPNYSANLSELTGKLSAFSSEATQGQVQLADLELRGRAEGTASLEILGKVNPLAKPLALDIKGKVRDLELPPLSPYSVKYAGHGIERGKLSVDVAYLVKPDGQLTASNQIILNQLTFGDKVEGAPASLPVKLAVALLSDRNGVIDINLPISGSLNDPQFSLGPIIFKVIVNLIVKAITSPFSLLASAFGGGDELSAVAFAPGSAVLLPEARTGLDKVARALTDRPALKMTVVGTASLEAEREAYKRERLRALLVSEKRRSLLASGATAAQAGGALTVSDAEVPGLLKEVYKRADITKPRNLAGVATEIPTEEMEALLLANITASEDTMRELAVQRGVAVKDYLGAQNLPVERLFLGAVKPAVANDPKWAPRAELILAN